MTKQERDFIILEFSKHIQENMGNRITGALGTGLMHSLNALLPQAEEPKPEEKKE